MARPERRMPSPVSSKTLATSRPMTTPSRTVPVARNRIPSTSMKAGAPVWKETSDAPRSAAHSRKQSRPAAGKA